MVLVLLFRGWIDGYGTSNKMTLTQIDVVFLMPVGIKVVWSNSVHIVLLEINGNFHLLKALIVYIKENYILFNCVSLQV